MSGYFDRIEAHLLDAVECHAEQRSRPVGALRERLSAVRGWLRGHPGLLALVGVLALSGSAAGAVLLSGQHSRTLSGVVPPYDSRGNLSVAGSRYDIEITPWLQTGDIGWCNFIFFRDIRELRGKGLGSGACATGTPAVGSPLFAPDGDQGEGLWYVLAAPQVAAVRVANGPTVLTRSDPRLPYGYRAAVFELPRKAVSHGPPQLTALAATGRAIPGGAYAETPQEPTRSWSYPQSPARGACSLTVSRDSSLHMRQGTVLTAITPDPGIIGRAFLPCMDVQLSLHGASLVAALLLDARHPGAPPAALPDMRPVPGASGFYSRSSAELELMPRHRDSLTARQVGNAWLVIAGADGAQQGIRALRALTVGPIDLRTPRSAPRVPANAQCTIGVHPLAGLREVSQTSYLIRGRAGHAFPRRGPAELTPCVHADFYYQDWPLSATVMVPIGGPGTPRPLQGRQPVPDHPNLFTIAAEAETGRRDIAQRIGSVWIEIHGGSGPRQQLAVLGQIDVTVARSRPAALRRLLPPMPFGGGLGLLL